MAVGVEHPERHVAGSDMVRDLILGMSDGLTTPFALAAALVGASTSNLLVVIGGLAEIAGGYVGAGLIPLAPYFFPLPLGTALLASCLLTGAALTGFGALKGRYVGAPTARSAIQTLFVGGTAAAIAFLTGRVLSQLAS